MHSLLWLLLQVRVIWAVDPINYNIFDNDPDGSRTTNVKMQIGQLASGDNFAASGH